MLKIALAGLGTVGSHVVSQLHAHAEMIAARAGQPIVIRAVSARTKGKSRACDVSGITWVDDPVALASLPDIDVVVELMGGAEGTARHLAEATLAHGKHLVTANKALLAAHGVELAKHAEQKNVQIMFESAVAGGIPIIKTLREALAGDDVTSVRGILNGTCNYILTRMRDAGLDFAAALSEAQSLGYAEADPTADIGGHDTANKLAILSALAFGIVPDVNAIAVRGIERIALLDLRHADELGYAIKLLGIATKTAQGIMQQVEPVLVAQDAPLARIDGALNAVQVHGARVGDITLQGLGAGGMPTADAVVADLVDLARGHRTATFGCAATALRAVHSVPAPAARYYLRLAVQDRHGVVAEISSILRDEEISIQSLLQRGMAKDGVVPVVILTHKTEAAVIARAVQKIADLTPVVDRPCLLRMEE